MDTCNRTQSADRLWPYLIAAALGTFLLAFVSSGVWPGGAGTPETTLSAVVARHLLTVLLLLIVPAVWARIALLRSPWMLALLAAFTFGCGLVLTGDPKEAAYTLLLCALPGVGLWGLFRLKLSNFRTVIYGSFVILAALYGFVCLKDLIRSGDAYASYKYVVGLYGEAAARADLSAYGESGKQLAEEAAAFVDLFRANAESFCVPLLLLPSMAAALSNVLFSHLFNRRGGAALTPLPHFSEWRCERWYVLLTAAFLLAVMLLGLCGVRAADALSDVAGLLWRMPCTLGGLAAVRRLAVLSGRKWIFWAAVVLLVLLPPVTSMLLSLLGLMTAMRRPGNVGEDGGRK